MASQRRQLNQLKIAEPCSQSWGGMQEGPGGRRYCDECERQVFDFRQMTPRNIRAHLEASQGQMCARLTFESGRLQMLEPEVAQVPAAPPRKTLPLAATLLGLCLGAGAAQAQTPAPAAISAETTPRSDESTEAEKSKNREHPSVQGGIDLQGQLVDQDGFLVA